MSQLPASSPSFLTDFRKRQVVAVVFAVVMGCVYLRISQYCGHLSKELGFDDVMYGIDGAGRLLIAADHGVCAFVKSFWKMVPHSPFSSLLALIGFSVGGVSELSLYAANILILIAVACFLASELKGVRKGMFAICLAVVFLSPISYRVIEETRPDIALGVITAIMGWWFTGAMMHGDAKLYKKAGIALGLCFLIKPTFFAHTIAMSCSLVGLFTLAQIASRCGASFVAKSKMSHLMWFVGLAALVASPYFARNGLHVFHYFWDNAVGAHHEERSLSKAYSMREVLDIFFDAWNYFGISLRFLLAGIAGAVVLLIWRGAKTEAFRLLAFMVMAAASLTVMIVGRHNNPFFLSTFQWTVLFAAVFAIAALHTSLPGVWKHVLVAVCASSLVYCVFTRDTHWRAERSNAQYSDAYKGNGTGWNQKLFDQIRTHQEAQTDGGRFARAGSYWNKKLLFTIPKTERFAPVPGIAPPPPRVFFASTGDVNRCTFLWTSLKSGFAADTIDVLSTQVADSIKLAETSEYTIVATEGACIDRLMLNYKVQEAFTQWIAANPGFKRMPDISPSPKYVVYVNSAFFPPVVAWSGKWSDGWIGAKSSFSVASCERATVRLEITPISVPEFLPNTVTIQIAGALYKKVPVVKNTVIQVDIPAEKLAGKAQVDIGFDRSHTPRGETRGLCAQVRVLN